ncbi:glycosyltransferase family 4 protein [Gemmatimonas sp.]|jgi:glycosyltransferase involved in cell wall biosynthesis|uniref:glycosyltransferase family 4 protein n=1 Tax=Gemmatimonas sp. TaxID=1962908 RepID=UPI0022C554C8|nr:glycosyltransferase family 4 protein [Gemmatimonas sp.]MCZ8204279.1 glycosyltransferase family 4 protein [Gemmatimonas sp.]
MILHVIDALNRGGAERVLVDLVTALLPLANEAMGACTTRAPGELSGELPAAVRHFSITRQERWDFRALRHFRRLVRAEQVTLVHVHSRSTLAFVAAALAGRPGRPRIVMHDHFGRLALEPHASRAYRWIVGRYVDHYITVSEELHQWAMTRLGLPPSRCTMINNGVPMARFQRLHTHRGNRHGTKLRALFVANLRPEKNHLALVRAIAMSPVLRRTLHVQLVGSGAAGVHGEEVAALIQRLGVRDNIALHGASDRVDELLAAADFGIVASRSEAGPVVAIEYMAAGLPYVSTPVGNIFATARAHECCIVSEGRRAEDLSAALERMCALSDTERTGMGARARVLVAERFSVEQQASTVASLYTALRHGAAA